MVHKLLANAKSLPVSSARFKRTSMAVAVAALGAVSFNASAQGSSELGLEEVIITGTRAIVQDSIDLKRNSITIVDGLSADEIGSIPALSIGDALETITSAASHRENGGATEVSVRGMGPFLGTTVVNGREASNGGGNRAVNFSIFPSEMFNKIAIHKTQSAEYVEGAVSGQIHLDTKKPLEYGKRLTQLNIKGGYAPQEWDIDNGEGQHFSHRGTFAFIDQFDFGALGDVGVSFGMQLRNETNPEQEYTTTSGGGRLEACELDSFSSTALPARIDGNSRCDSPTVSEDGETIPVDVSNNGVANLIARTDGYTTVDDIPFAYIPRDHRYRQNVTSDEREAYFGSIQWQPNDKLDIMFDYQLSERDQREERHDLQFGTTQVGISQLTSNPSTGVVYSSTSETDIRIYSTDFQRLEEYDGFGLNVEYMLTDDIKVSFDYAESNTTRTETDIEMRLGATQNNEEGASRTPFTVILDTNQGSGTALAEIIDDGDSDFEVTDLSYFNARDRAQLRGRQIIRENSIDSFRADLEWNVDSFFTTFKAGARWSSLEYLTLGGNRNTAKVNFWDHDDLTPGATNEDNDVTDAIVSEILSSCGTDFAESGFLSNVSDGPLITNSANSSETNPATTTNSFATFDRSCASDIFLQNYGGNRAMQLLNGYTTGTNDVTEDTFAFYAQADFDSELAGFPVRGNIGVRVVNTDISSIGYRAPLSITERLNENDEFVFYIDGTVNATQDAVSDFTLTEATSSYTEVLPSATFIMDLSDELVLRAGVFRGLSRPDPNAYGNGFTVPDDGDETFYLTQEDAERAIFSTGSLTGNPSLKPLTSWNYDLGIEWYANEDTLLSAGVYYKEFLGSFENVALDTTYEVTTELRDGAQGTETLTGQLTSTQTSDETSTIQGFELTASHSLSYLPGVLSGLGGKFSLNYADSDFETEDQHGGDGTQVIVDQETGEVTTSPLIGILEPANLFGLSELVTSTQVYWDWDKINLQAIYKTRSDYFQQYTRDTQGRNRYTEDNSTLDFRARYKFNSNFELSFEAKNILDEPRIDYRGIEGNVLQTLSYGPRYFLGAKVKF